MRDSEKTTILVTGATDGLGRAVAERLAVDGATVLMHGRDRARLDAAVEEVRAAAGHDRVTGHLADLAALAEVHALAADVERATDALHVLVNNAGIGTGKPDLSTRQESDDGHELRLAVNHLAGFALTRDLLGLLRRSAPARIVLVASLGQAPMDFSDPMLEHDYTGSRAYGQSKLAQITAGFALAEQLDPSEVTVNSLHPGTFMPTKIVMQERGASMDSLDTGVSAVVRLAVAPELEGVSGRFYDREREARADRQAYDTDARERLVALSAKLTAAG